LRPISPLFHVKHTRRPGHKPAGGLSWRGGGGYSHLAEESKKQ